MTLFRWSLLLASCLAAYYSPDIIGWMGFYVPAGNGWFDFYSSISLLNLMIILFIGRTWLPICLAITELLSISTIGLSYYQFMSEKNGTFYNNHETIIYSIAVVQCLLLVLGVPRGGNNNMVIRLGHSFANWYKAPDWGILRHYQNPWGIQG